ncbi:Rho guanine nucleotide exchange factor 3-like isoform X4 [Oopsacas minuta]|uniref:Rho guanine nucleotide exchange factor 3-like isoform X4 n=1 Tax=Oopsacas minuta TaxID=111878 RepID=A0AAV7JYV4_9METZ|nr:Rho guanine nucleotide exchange factor 3-like isoform X4 [Oopsacas minuta]
MSDNFNDILTFHRGSIDEYPAVKSLTIPKSMAHLFEPLPIFPGVENLPPKDTNAERKSKTIRKRKFIEPVELEPNDTKKPRKPFSIVNRVSRVIDAPSLKRSFSLRDRTKVSVPANKPTECQAPQRSRRSFLERNYLIATNWVDTIAEPYSCYSTAEIKIQEAIYTLYRTEIEYLQDLEMVVHKIAKPMLRLDLVSPDEYDTIFSNIEKLIPIHENIIVRLQQIKCIDGTFGEIVTPFLEWIPVMTEAYVKYCPNLVFAKELFQVKKQKQTFCDYLEKCREYEFMRKIDFWTFLDSPRSRLMKYPLMLKEISRLGGQDRFALDSAINKIEDIITVTDMRTGFAKCDSVKQSFQYLTEAQRLPEIESSTTLHFMGEMRNKHNTRLTVFLLDKVLIITRATPTKSGTIYHIHRQPVTLNDLEFENIPDSNPGSFRRRSAINLNRNLIRFSSKSKQVNSLTLQCHSDFDKKAWMDALSSAV